MGTALRPLNVDAGWWLQFKETAKSTAINRFAKIKAARTREIADETAALRQLCRLAETTPDSNEDIKICENRLYTLFRDQTLDLKGSVRRNDILAGESPTQLLREVLRKRREHVQIDKVTAEDGALLTGDHVLDAFYCHYTKLFAKASAGQDPTPWLSNLPQCDPL